MKELWIDCETTGTDASRHALHQVSGVLINGSEGYFDYKFKPNGDADFSMSAFEATDTSLKEVYTRDLVEYDAWKNFVSLLNRYVNKYDRDDKLIMYGYNVRFDYDFLYAWFKSHDKYGIGSYVWFPPIDVMNLAAHYLRARRVGLADFKQSSVAAALGIEVAEDKLHDARYDIALTRAIYEKVVDNAQKSS